MNVHISCQCGNELTIDCEKTEELSACAGIIRTWNDSHKH